MQDVGEALIRQIEQQISGLRYHLICLREPHHRVETNTRRALGHAQEAIRLSLKLRRLYASRRPRASTDVQPIVPLSEEG